MIDLGLGQYSIRQNNGNMTLMQQNPKIDSSFIVQLFPAVAMRVAE